MTKLPGIFLFAVVVAASIDALGQETRPTIDRLGFMSGCWAIDQPSRNMSISEHWMSPAGGSMIGMGRTIRNDKLISFEFLRIVQDDTGLHYIAKPSQSKNETAFKLIKWSAAEAVFENPAHDFPQRIIYRSTDKDTLNARIEGTMNGKSSGMDFPYKRIRCP